MLLTTLRLTAATALLQGATLWYSAIPGAYPYPTALISVRVRCGRCCTMLMNAHERDGSGPHSTPPMTILEKQLGTRLFNRRSRNSSLTESGKLFFERCEV